MPERSPTDKERSDHPTAVEMLDSLLPLIGGVAVCGPMLPGLTLCVPGLILLAVVVLAPLVAIAALVTLAAAILAIPYLLVRSIRSRRAVLRSRAGEAAGRRIPRLRWRHAAG